MPVTSTVWWTDEKVAATVNRDYVLTQLQTNEQEFLLRKPRYPGIRQNETYLDRTLNDAKRLFLILAATGVPDQIFGLLDDGFDDGHLPIPEEKVPQLRLSLTPDRSLDKRFYKTQFKFLARIPQESEHIRYADDENVPVIPLGLKSVVSTGKEGLDTVRLPAGQGRTLTRKRVKLTSTLVEEDALSEIVTMMRFSHEHVESFFGSYCQNESLFILLKPAFEWTLRLFLIDQPKVFDSLFKSEKRQILANWPHCLASALAWLHANGSHHGAIRPSNIYVTHEFEITLGLMDGEGVLCISAKADDIEAYQYAAPEKWKRAVTLQNSASRRQSLSTRSQVAKSTIQPEHAHSSDPSLRKRSGSSLGTHSTDSHPKFQAVIPVSKSHFPRYKLNQAPNFETQPMFSPVGSPRTGPNGSATSHSRTHTGTSHERSLRIQPSSAFSTHSGGGNEKISFALNQGLFAAAPESRTAVVQTWKSVEHDSFAADVFSLGAVTLDVLTVLCKKTFSSFVRQRAAKNRNAGRGGGLADASFHANLGQVEFWAQILSDEGEKKAKKDDSQVLRVVMPMVQVTIQCLNKNPQIRPSSQEFEMQLEDCLKTYAKLDTIHCKSKISQGQPQNLAFRERMLQSYGVSRTDSQNSGNNRSRVPPAPAVVNEYFPAPTNNQSLLSISNNDRPFVTPIMSPAMQHNAGWSPSPSRTLDSTIGSSASYHTSPSSYRYAEGDVNEKAYSGPTMGSVPHQMMQRHQQKHQFGGDPGTRKTSARGMPGAFTYMNYSANTSDNEDEEGESTVYAYPIPPSVRSPRRDSLMNRQFQQASPSYSSQSDAQGLQHGTGHSRSASQLPSLSQQQRRPLVSPSPNQAAVRTRQTSQDILVEQSSSSRNLTARIQEPQSRFRSVPQGSLEELQEEKYEHGEGQGEEQLVEEETENQNQQQVYPVDASTPLAEQIINLDFGPARSQAGRDYERMYR